MPNPGFGDSINLYESWTGAEIYWALSRTYKDDRGLITVDNMRFIFIL